MDLNVTERHRINWLPVYLVYAAIPGGISDFA